MNPSTTKTRQCLRAGLIFGGCLLAVLLLPYAGIALNSNVLFFAPQYLFPYRGFVSGQPHGPEAVFGESMALLLNVLQWCFAAVGFAWFARRMTAGFGVLAAVATIMLVGIFVNLGFAAFGVTLELDGP